MDLDNITDIEELREICKHNMVKIKETIYTPTSTYEKGKWYYLIQDDEEIFIYLDPRCGLNLTYEEAEKYLEW